MNININIQWLQKIAEQITNKETTIAEAANKALFDSPMGVYLNPISPSCLRNYFSKYNIKYSTYKGRKKFEIPQDIENVILSYQKNLNSGEKVTFYSIIHHIPYITFTQVRATFEKHSLYKYRSPHKQEKTRCRYEAKWVNQIWHADIHYFQKPGMQSMMYLYCLMDDRSRFIVGHGLMPSKTQDACIYVLNIAIQTYGAPCMMWTDNGGENKGQVMLNFLKEKRIYPVFTEPGNPEQNGKIERFWKNLEKCTTCPDDIPNYIIKYNTIRANMALCCDKIYLRPKDIFYDHKYRWKRGYEWKWIVDGKEIDFPYEKDKKIIYYD